MGFDAISLVIVATLNGIFNCVGYVIARVACSKASFKVRQKLPIINYSHLCLLCTKPIQENIFNYKSLGEQNSIVDRYLCKRFFEKYVYTNVDCQQCTYAGIFGSLVGEKAWFRNQKCGLLGSQSLLMVGQ